MAFINEKLTDEQKREFINRGIKRPWSERIATPIYRTIDIEKNMCLWKLGNLGRDFFNHYMFLFEWKGEEYFVIMEYVDPDANEDRIVWSLSKYEKKEVLNQAFAEDFEEALIVYAVNGRPDQQGKVKVDVDLKGGINK